MGRQVRRVAADFDWPMHKVWIGYWWPFKSMDCPWCEGGGLRDPYKSMRYEEREAALRVMRDDPDYEAKAYCPHCDGDGQCWPTEAIREQADSWETYDPPTGEGWQMWETTSEGSPISPVFTTPEELARWLADSNASSFGSQSASYESWLAMIRREWAPSAVFTPGKGMQSGVDFVAEEQRDD